MKRFTLLLLLVACELLFAQDTLQKKQFFFINGYFKDLQSFTYVREPPLTTNLNDLQNRLNTKFDFGHGFSLRAEIRNRLFLGDQIKRTPGFGKSLDSDDGLADLSFVKTN